MLSILSVGLWGQPQRCSRTSHSVLTNHQVLALATGRAMADSKVGTKAPESDEVVQSLFPGDTPAQQGASMGVIVSHTSS